MVINVADSAKEALGHAAVAVNYAAASLIATLTGSVVYGSEKKLTDLCITECYEKPALGNTPGLAERVEELTGTSVRVLSYDSEWGRKWNSGGSPIITVRAALDLLGEFSSSYTDKKGIVVRECVGPFGKRVLGIGLYDSEQNACVASILMAPQKSQG